MSEDQTAAIQPDEDIIDPVRRQLIAEKLARENDVMRLLRESDFNKNSFQEGEFRISFVVTTSFADFAENVISRGAIVINDSEKHEAMAKALDKPHPGLAFFAGKIADSEAFSFHISVNRDHYRIGNDDYSDLMIYDIYHELYEAWVANCPGSRYSRDGSPLKGARFKSAHFEAENEELKAAARDGKLARLVNFEEAHIRSLVERLPVTEIDGIPVRELEKILKMRRIRGNQAEKEVAQEPPGPPEISDDDYWRELAREMLISS